ncbi:hypothetical protein NE237_000930 [Protea cynaroides]|uniref:Uncharacterized protein n=1 Tax=Protea cynaroides TaxID=273540 RepID=A0A9Q0QXY8_9MAGN|nr:hypothetical protein NE237_000930 [Protea cynaroides]
MKISFLEFVLCCGHPIQPTAPKTPRKEVQRRRLTRSNSVSSSSSSSGQWQPTLSAISEDNMVSVVVGKVEEAPNSGKKVARKTTSKAEIRVRTSYGDDFGRVAVPFAIPTFSPTGFFF